MVNLANQGMGTKVFTFQESDSDSTEFSSATLNNSPEAALPYHFLICSSHSQQQIDTDNTHNIYLLYGDENFTKPWFSIGIYSSYKLWAEIDYKHWYGIGYLKRETFLNWIHICVEVDTVTSTLRASVNGGNVTTVKQIEGLTLPPRLHLRLGVVHESYFGKMAQFTGSVGNINIFNMTSGSHENISAMASRNPCKLFENSSNSSYLTWSKANWNVLGNGVKEKEVEEKNWCAGSQALNFRIPLQWNKIEATEECKKYGDTHLTKPTNPSNLTNTNWENLYGEYYHKCLYFWTPYTDEYSEGIFIDEITNETR